MSTGTAYAPPKIAQAKTAKVITHPTAKPSKQHMPATADDAFATAMLGPKGRYALDHSEDVVYEWSNTHWAAVDDIVGERRAALWLRTYFADKATAGGARTAWAFTKLAAADDAPVPEPAQGDDVIIPTRGAYLRVDSTGRITAEEHERAAGMRYLVAADAVGAVIGTEYVPAPLPEDSMFGRFLAHAQTDAGVRDFIQEQCALTLMPGQPQLAAWWYGAKGSGKSTLADIIKRFHHRACALDLKNLDGFRLEKIVGASLVIASEVERGRWNEGVFKQLTGGDEVQIDRKGRPVISYVSDAKWIIFSNLDPWITDPTGAVHRRITPVRWARTVSSENRDKKLVARIMRDEAHIVLDWLLAGVQRIMRDHGGQFRPESKWPAQVRRWAREIRGAANPVADWIDSDKIAVSARATHTRRDIFAAFSAWMDGHGEHELISEPVFWRAFWNAGEVAGAKDPAHHVSGTTANGKRTMVPVHRVALGDDLREGEPVPEARACDINIDGPLPF